MARKSRRRATKRRERRHQKRSSESLINLWTVGALAVILVGFIGFLVANRLSSPTTTAQGSTSSQRGTPYPDVPRMPLEEAKAKYDAGTALIVDTRSRDEYDRQHISGALSVPLAELNSREPDLPRDQELILYCT